MRNHASLNCFMSSRFAEGIVLVRLGRAWVERFVHVDDSKIIIWNSQNAKLDGQRPISTFKITPKTVLWTPNTIFGRENTMGIFESDRPGVSKRSSTEIQAEFNSVTEPKFLFAFSNKDAKVRLLNHLKDTLRAVVKAQSRRNSTTPIKQSTYVPYSAVSASEHENTSTANHVAQVVTQSQISSVDIANDGAYFPSNTNTPPLLTNSFSNKKNLVDNHFGIQSKQQQSYSVDHQMQNTLPVSFAPGRSTTPLNGSGAYVSYIPSLKNGTSMPRSPIVSITRLASPLPHQQSSYTLPNEGDILPDGSKVISASFTRQLTPTVAAVNSRKPIPLGATSVHHSYTRDVSPVVRVSQPASSASFAFHLQNTNKASASPSVKYNNTQQQQLPSHSMRAVSPAPPLPPQHFPNSFPYVSESSHPLMHHPHFPAPPVRPLTPPHSSNNHFQTFSQNSSLLVNSALNGIQGMSIRGALPAVDASHPTASPLKVLSKSPTFAPVERITQHAHDGVSSYAPHVASLVGKSPLHQSIPITSLTHAASISPSPVTPRPISHLTKVTLLKTPPPSLNQTHPSVSPRFAAVSLSNPNQHQNASFQGHGRSVSPVLPSHQGNIIIPSLTSYAFAHPTITNRSFTPVASADPAVVGKSSSSPYFRSSSIMKNPQDAVISPRQPTLHFKLNTASGIVNLQTVNMTNTIKTVNEQPNNTINNTQQSQNLQKYNTNLKAIHPINNNNNNNTLSTSPTPAMDSYRFLQPNIVRSVSKATPSPQQQKPTAMKQQQHQTTRLPGAQTDSSFIRDQADEIQSMPASSLKPSRNRDGKQSDVEALLRLNDIMLPSGLQAALDAHLHDCAVVADMLGKDLTMEEAAAQEGGCLFGPPENESQNDGDNASMRSAPAEELAWEEQNSNLQLSTSKNRESGGVASTINHHQGQVSSSQGNIFTSLQSGESPPATRLISEQAVSASHPSGLIPSVYGAELQVQSSTTGLDVMQKKITTSAICTHDEAGEINRMSMNADDCAAVVGRDTQQDHIRLFGAKTTIAKLNEAEHIQQQQPSVSQKKKQQQQHNSLSTEQLSRGFIQVKTINDGSSQMRQLPDGGIEVVSPSQNVFEVGGRIRQHVFVKTKDSSDGNGIEIITDRPMHNSYVTNGGTHTAAHVGVKNRDNNSFNTSSQNEKFVQNRLFNVQEATEENDNVNSDEYGHIAFRTSHLLGTEMKTMNRQTNNMAEVSNDNYLKLKSVGGAQTNLLGVSSTFASSTGGHLMESGIF